MTAVLSVSQGIEMKENFGPYDIDRVIPVQSRLPLCRTEDGRTRVGVRLQDDTVWMTQATMAELYQTTPQNITLHLKAIYQEGELDPQATCKEVLQVQIETSSIQCKMAEQVK